MFLRDSHLNPVIFEFHCSNVLPRSIKTVVAVSTPGVVTVEQSINALFQQLNSILGTKLLWRIEPVHANFLS